jgi:hypothetical protein
LTGRISASLIRKAIRDREVVVKKQVGAFIDPSLLSEVKEALRMSGLPDAKAVEGQLLEETSGGIPQVRIEVSVSTKILEATVDVLECWTERPLWIADEPIPP